MRISQAGSDLSLHRFAMSYRKYARLIWVKSDAAKCSGFSINENLNQFAHRRVPKVQMRLCLARPFITHSHTQNSDRDKSTSRMFGPLDSFACMFEN